METDEDEEKLILGTSKLAAQLLQLTTSQSETQTLNFLLLCDPLTRKPVKVVAVSAVSGPFVEPSHLSHS